MAATQYQHYIPQFILRRFALASPVDSRRSKKPQKKKTGNEMVKAVDLAKDVAEITTAPVKRTFGRQDMYKDDSKYSQVDQMRMETKLGEIEQAASRVIARVVVAHAMGKDGISLSRSDKDLLRKFQFVMKYRGPLFFQRFNHQTAEEYDSNDWAEFLKYMRTKGFKRPLDVWFDNLIKIIDKPMDPDGHWIQELHATIYPPDAEWLFLNIRSKYLAFVTPSAASDEFILTDNAFGIHEGPVSCTINRFTGVETMTAYTEYHLLTVISPQLAMVLRHNSMPEPIEDLDPKRRKQKREDMAVQASMHVDPENATSMLQDLPVAKAHNSYTVLHHGRLVLAEGADGKLRASDTFHFLFFRLESRHVQLINTVMLDQAHKVTKIVFQTESALRKALEFYLSWPVQTKGTHSMKTVSDRPDDPRLLLLRKLEHVAQLLGSDVKAEYHVEPLMDGNLEGMRERLERLRVSPNAKVTPDPVGDASRNRAGKVQLGESGPGGTRKEVEGLRGTRVPGFSKKGLRNAFDEIGRDI